MGRGCAIIFDNGKALDGKIDFFDVDPASNLYNVSLKPLSWHA